MTRDLTELLDPDSAVVTEALTRTCDLCKARKGCLCNNTIDPDEPIPYRLVHHGRCTDRSRETKEDE